MTKLCKDCKHYRKDWISHLLGQGTRHDLCVSPNDSNRVNLISGKVPIQFCEIERNYEPPIGCGKKESIGKQKMTERLKNPDEIVLENVKLFHLESMAPEHLWAAAYCEDGRIFHLNISAKGGKLSYYWSQEAP